jgi:PAS domain S-box-containing protein
MGLTGSSPWSGTAPGTAGAGKGDSSRLVLAGSLLVLLLWVLDAAIDAIFFGERTFSDYLFAPSPHELADFSVVFVLAGCLLLYSRRLSRVRDALERVQQDALLKAEKERAKVVALIDTIPNPIYYQDPSGRFLGCNAAFAEWLDRPRERIVGHTLTEIAPSQVCRVFRQQEPGPGAGTVCESPVLRGDGVLRDVIFYKTLLSDGAGEVGVMIDITERKHTEEGIAGLNDALLQQTLELHHANRELEAFSHAISHDLRTPLTRISCSGQMLLEYGELLDEKELFFVKSINEGCRQVEAMLDALLVLSRVTESELASEEVDLSSIAEQKAAELHLAEQRRSVNFRIAPRLLVQGDPQLLQIALDNLIGNAWKYTARAAEPSIEFGALTGQTGETVYFLKDNGAGFDSARSDQLFKPFSRLHSKQDFSGTGLGLATVHRIITRHKGRVWGEGKPGAGATFYFTVNG